MARLPLSQEAKQWKGKPTDSQPHCRSLIVESQTGRLFRFQNMPVRTDAPMFKHDLTKAKGRSFTIKPYSIMQIFTTNASILFLVFCAVVAVVQSRADIGTIELLS
jgi:hypothetical protein